MYNNFDIMLGDNIQNKKKRYHISNQSILLIVTVVCVLLFLFLIIKSLQIRKINKQDVELLHSNSENVIVKEVENEIKVDNLNVGFYDLMDASGEDIDEIKINDEDFINNSDLDSKISELFDIKSSYNQTEDNSYNSDILNDIIENNIINNKDNSKQFVVDNEINGIKLKQNDINNIDSIQKVGKKGIKVQLGAMKTNEFAIEYRDNILAMYGDLFKDLECFIEGIDLKERGVFYRLRFGIFKTKKDAENFCSKYIKLSNGKLSSCIVIDE